jgi:hypothetical protein
LNGSVGSRHRDDHVVVAVLRQDRPHQRSHNSDDDGAADDYVEENYQRHIDSFSGSKRIEQESKPNVGTA